MVDLESPMSEGRYYLGHSVLSNFSGAGDSYFTESPKFSREGTTTSRHEAFGLQRSSFRTPCNLANRTLAVKFYNFPAHFNFSPDLHAQLTHDTAPVTVFLPVKLRQTFSWQHLT